MNPKYANESQFKRFLVDGVPYWISDAIKTMIKSDFIQKKDSDRAFSVVADYEWNLDQILYKSEKQKWTMKFDLGENVSKVQTYYKAALFYDPLELEEAIERIEKNIKQLKNEPTLIKEEDEKMIARWEKEIDEKYKNIRINQRDYPTICFGMRVEKVEYPGHTKIEAYLNEIDAIAIAKNGNKNDNYKLLIIPE